MAPEVNSRQFTVCNWAKKSRCCKNLSVNQITRNCNFNEALFFRLNVFFNKLFIFFIHLFFQEVVDLLFKMLCKFQSNDGSSHSRTLLYGNAIQLKHMLSGMVITMMSQFCIINYVDRMS